VASGHANKAVAAELFLSVKTVEAALSRIYRKLDVSSRTQLAARLGPGDHPQM
jgi:DNA-binding NarL/FixJ family response regulator